jgi:hypothetical protein
VRVYTEDVRIKRPVGSLIEPIGAKRGVVNGLSRAAARRLAFAVRNTPELATPGADWVGLTYPADYPRDGRACKRHLDTFGKWLRRHGGCAVWCLEYQTRGAPHFHLIVRRRGLQSLLAQGDWRKELASAWYRIVGSGDAKHLRAGTSSDPVRHPERVGTYMATYISKADQKTVPADVTLPGRMWGMIGCRPLLVHEVRATVHETAPLVRIARRAARSASASRRRAVRPPTAAEAAELVEQGRYRTARAARADARFVPPADAVGAFYRPKDPGRGRGLTVYGGGPAVREYLRRTRRTSESPSGSEAARPERRSSGTVGTS